MGKQQVTERDIRLPQFKDSKLEDLEFDASGDVVRKDRFETSMRKISGMLHGVNELSARSSWTCEQVVEALKIKLQQFERLEELILIAEFAPEDAEFYHFENKCYVKNIDQDQLALARGNQENSDLINHEIEGLFNSSKVGATNVTTSWATATAQQILDDINLVLNNAWIASGFAVCPDKLLLPPKQFGWLTTRIVSEAGNISILEFLKINCLAMSVNGKPLDIQPSKWAVGRGVGGTDRMMTYTQSENRVRFPLVPLQRTPLEYRDLRQLTTYFGRLGAVEWVYPETAYYADGL